MSEKYFSNWERKEATASTIVPKIWSVSTSVHVKRPLTHSQIFANRNIHLFIDKNSSKIYRRQFFWEIHLITKLLHNIFLYFYFLKCMHILQKIQSKCTEKISFILDINPFDIWRNYISYTLLKKLNLFQYKANFPFLPHKHLNIT